MALSILPHLLKEAAKKLNINKEIVILTATSGDTGKAALEGFANIEGTKVIVFYPKKGVSRIQERQMTTQKGSNTYVVAIDGSFDDAQKGVKAIFNGINPDRIVKGNLGFNSKAMLQLVGDKGDQISNLLASCKELNLDLVCLWPLRGWAREEVGEYDEIEGKKIYKNYEGIVYKIKDNGSLEKII